MDYAAPPADPLLGSFNVTDRPADLAVRGDMVYVVASDSFLNDPPTIAQILAIDVSFPEFPSLLNDRGSFWGHAAIAIEGDHAYAVGPSLARFEISDPFQITPAGFLDEVEFPAQDATLVTVDGGHAYVATESERLLVVDVSGDPVIVGELAIPSNHLNDLAVRDGYVYIAGHGGVFVVDATVPDAPVHTETVSTANQATSIGVLGNVAVVSVFTLASAVLDISDPSSPSILGSGPSLGTFTTSGALVYAVVASTLTVYDFSDPTDPTDLGSLPGVLAFDVAVDGCRVATFNPFFAEELRLFPSHRPGIVAVPGADARAPRIVRSSPNPFRTRTTLHLAALEAEPGPGTHGPIGGVTIADVTGRIVRRLEAGAVTGAGLRDVHWDGRDDLGRRAAPGTYVVQVRTSDGSITGRVTVLH